MATFPCRQLRAEGSKELNAHGGGRAYMLSTTTVSTTNPFPTLGTVNVFVKAGETVYLGSSAQGIGNGYMVIRMPNGTTVNTANRGATGRIANRTQEINGPIGLLNLSGYNAITYTVTAAQAGIWEIDFISPNQSNAANPPPISASGSWTQPSSAYVAAWDVTVRGTDGNVVTGRTYADVFTGNLGAANQPFNALFYILTKDGYRYTVNNNGQAGFGFSFFVNNKGSRTSTGAPSYKSIDDLALVNLKDPRSTDDATNITHKIFYNTPAADLPASAPTPSGTTWLVTTPTTPVASAYTFTGAEGTANTAGTNPAGGYFGFTANVGSNYALDVDVNRNGVYSDAVDRRLTGTASAGVNSVFWDGLDGTGAKVTTTSGTASVNVRVILFGGEVHFPFIDVENNVNGIIITRTNGDNAGNIVNWDDSGISTAGTTPSNPIKTGIDGISSAVNGHKWGSTSYSGTDFGNEVLLDTWAYVQSSALTNTATIVIQESDLETVSITPSTSALCVGQTVTYTILMRNNGPAAITGAQGRLTFPASLTNISFGTPSTSGTTITASSTTATQLDATMTMNNGGTVTFTVTGTVSSFPSGGTLPVTASIMRAADYTDPDATNPDAAAPTDPQGECDSAPSGVGCNNIKISSLVVSPVPSTSNAGPDQSLCALTSTTLAGNNPTTGTGVWTQVSGPTTATFASAGTFNTTVSNLATGTYNFRWTISSGICAVSTDEILVTVLPALAGNSITAPATITFCGSGDAAVITGSTPTGGTGTYTYQWQSSTDNITYTNISGATGATYDPPGATVTTFYRRQVTSGGCSTPLNSNAVTITIQPALANNTVTAPATTVFCGSGNADIITGTVPTGGNGAYSYQWQSSLDNSNWSNLSGATAQAYDPVSVGVTVYYRRLVTSGTCTSASISNTITITVNPALTAGSVGSNQTFCISGDPAAFTQTSAPTGGNGTYTYQWQVSTTSSSAGFADISGATAATYDAPVISVTSYYRRVVSSVGCSDATSAVITVVVTPGLTPGAVAASQSFCASGDPAVFTQTTAPTGGNGVYSYQWQSSVTSASSGFADISGATAATYDAPSLSVTTYFRRIVRSDACAEGISNVLTVTINPAISNNSVAVNQTICSGSTPAALSGTLPTGGSGTYTYRWESSTTGAAGFVTASGTATTQNYTPGALTQATIYRRIVSSAACGEVASNIIQISVTAAPTTANAGPDQGPLNATSVTLAGNTPTVGTGSWTQVSGPNTANIQNPSLPGTSVSGLAAGTYVFRWTISNSPCAASADDVTIIRNAAPVAQNDVATTNEDTQVAINVAANDNDADGTLLAGSVVIVTQPTYGTLTVNSNNTVTYVPAPNYNGSDNFSYTIKDNLNTVSNTATVTITVTPVNDVPVAGDDKINDLQDQVLNLPPPGLLANDVDPDGEQLSASVVTFPANGTLVINSDGSLTYTPRAGYVGQDVFSYKVCDASNTCDTGTVTIDIGNVNDVPVANADTYTVLEDNVLTVAAAGVLGNDTDADGDQLSATVITAPAKGTLTLNSNGSFVYTPNANANGPDSFTYNACDASGACSSATVTINITAVNDKPLAVDDAYNTNEDVALTVGGAGVITNDSDPDNDVLTATIITAPAHGTVTLNAAGNFVYTPAANYNGIDNFTYRLCDNGTPQLCDTGLVTITVSPVNDTVIITNDTYTTAEDVALSVGAPGVLGNDVDPDGDALTATVVTQPARGTLTFNANGSFVYTPAANYNGADSYTYRACDGAGACRVGTVNITVTAVNDAPVGIDDSYTLNEDVTLTIAAPGVLSNDTDIDGNALTVTVAVAPLHGTLTLNANGSFTYVPNSNYNGTDQFSYRVCDNGTPQLCDTGLVTLTVNPVNDVPVATDDTYTMAEDGTLNVTAAGVLVNDTDPDGNVLTASVITGPLNGTLTLNADGSFRYVPAANYNGTDLFIYRVCDNGGACDTATANITVTAVNDRPLSAPDSYTTSEDNTLTVAAPGVMFNDRDVDGDALTVSLVSTAANGTLTLNANGSLSFVPNANYNGVTSFVYRVCDGGALCDTNTATITVTAVNDVPVAANDTYTVTEDIPLTIAAPGLLANDTDADGDVLNASLLTAPQQGTIVINGNGSFVYTPASNYNGPDVFTYQVCDASGACVTGTVNLTVTAANDAPLSGDDAYTVGEDRVLTIATPGVLFNDVDIDNDPMTASVVRLPLYGTLALNTNGSFTYTPNANYNGLDTFIYRACDNGTPSLCDTAIVVLTVTPEADAPIAGDDNLATNEDVPLTITPQSLLANDTDADVGQTLTVSIYAQPANGTLSVNGAGNFVYTPNANFNGTDRFVYRVCDNGAPSLCDTATVTITVTAVNDAPVIRDDNYTAEEDAVLTVPASGVLLNDFEADGETMTALLLTQATHGTVVVAADGGFTYTPDPNFNGLDSFSYRACDASGNCTPGKVRIVVSPGNDVPVAVNDSYTLLEDTPLNIAAPGVIANDTDVDADSLTVSVNTQPTKGELTLNANGSFIYIPNADVNGVDSFKYNICDPGGACAIGTVVLNITPVNDTVQARDDEYNTDEDVVLVIAAPGVLQNDIDKEGDALTATLIGAVSPAQGTFTAFGTNGGFTFTPALDYNGTVTVEYRVCESNGACDTANIIINVGEENDPPVAVDDSRPEYAVGEDSILNIPASIGVLANDTDPDNVTVSASLATPPANGTVTLNADGSFTYIPNADFNGTDQFTYNVCDAGNLCDVGLVTITVRSVNDVPVAGVSSATTAEDTPLSATITGDTDIEGNTLAYAVVTPPTFGTITLNPNGTYTYTPNADFNGTDQLVYSVCDNGTPSLCDTGRLNITVTPVNDVPVVENENYTVNEDNTLVVQNTGVLSNDADKDGEPTVAVVTVPPLGQLSLNLDGTFTYTPRLNFNGIDSFTYRVCDVSNACAPGRAYITVLPVNDAPVAVTDTFYRAEDTVVTFPPAVVLINDVDVDGDLLSGYPIGSLSNGSFVANPDGTYTYTPAPNFNGTDYIDYVVCDNGNPSLCDTGHIVLIIQSRNDAPVALGDVYSMDEDGLLNMDAANGVLKNDTDPDGEALTSVIVNTSNGALTLNTNGSFAFRPNLNFNGVDSFTYRACDVAGVCDTAIVKINVAPVNDAPIAVDDAFTRSEDTVITFPASVILVNDIDVDGDVLTGYPLGNLTKGTFTTNPDGTYTYAPLKDFNGIDSIYYVVCDPGGLCDTGLIKLTITPVNDAPVANPVTYTVTEDTPLSESAPGIIGDDKDPDGEDIVATIVTAPLHGTISLNADGGFTYVPDRNYNGRDSLVYSLCDIQGACDTAYIYFVVTPVNDLPVVSGVTYTAAEDTPLTIAAPGVMVNSSDPDGDALTATLIDAPLHGTLTLNADGSFTYTPDDNYNGQDAFTVNVCDNGTPQSCVPITVTLNITAVDDTPVANSDSLATAEDIVLNVPAPGILANDVNMDGDVLTASIVTDPLHGQLTLDGGGNLVYRPALNYNGADSAVYRLCKANGLCDTAKIYITITPVNDRPVAVDDLFTRAEDTVITFPPSVVLINDIDVDGDVLTGHPFGSLTKGTFTANPDGTYTYSPLPNFNGVDSIQYEVCDPGGLCDTGLIRLIIVPRNDTPVAVDDAYATDEDIALSVPGPGVLANDTDVDDNDLLNVTILRNPSHGILQVNSNNSFLYTPDRNYNGVDTFLYVVYDAAGLRDTGTVLITVNSVNDAPIAADNVYTLDERTTVSDNMLTNDSDPDNDPLTATMITPPANGNINFNANGTFTYSPNSTFIGIDAITYMVCDPGGLCDTAVVTFNVQNVNDQPIAANDNVSVTEDTPATGNALTNDSDPDGDAFTATLLTGTINGTLVFNADGSFTYTPNANYNGLDSLVYGICDNGVPVLCDTAVVIFTVAPVNDQPVAVDDTLNLVEDTPATGNVLTNDSDPDGDALTASLVTAPVNGTVVLNADGSFTYTPNANYNGADSLVYQVCDNGTPSLCDTAVVRFTVSAVNDRPVAVDDAVAVTEDTPATGNVLTNDTDVEGDALTASLVTAPVNGTVVLNADGSFTYTPNANYNGADSLVYQVCDNGTPSLCDTAVVRFTVSAVNDRPVAVDDAVAVTEDTPATGNVLTNDTDVEGDALTASLVTAPVNGTVVLNSDGSFTYTPNANYNGADSLVYQVCDAGLCDTGVVRFTVSAVNDRPVAVDDVVAVTEDTPATGNVLTNDTDVEGDALTASLVTAPVNGTVVLNADGSFTYTPNANYNGADSLVYQVCDAGLCDTGVVRFTVSAVNDRPVAVDDAFAVTEDTPATGNVLTNDTDVEGDALTASLVTAPVNGTVVLNADGSFTYTPNANYNGADSLVYQVCDAGLCDTGVVRFTVSAVNDRPVAVDDVVAATEDTPATGNVLTNDTDVEGDALTASLVTAPVNGTVVLNADGSFTYTPNANYNGADSLVYQVCDAGLCDTGVVRFTVSAINDSPVAVDDAVAVTEDTPATGNVLTNDTDVEGDALTASLVTTPVNGTVVLNADGSFTYTPNANYNAADSLVYQVCDAGLCDTGVVRFTVSAVNDKPVAVDDVVAVTEDTPATGNVLTNDSDPDGDALTASLVTAPVNGTVVLNADGSFTYTPDANYNGLDSISYQACNTDGLCDTAVLRFTIAGVNDGPVAVNDSLTIAGGTVTNGNVTDNDTDPDGDNLSASLVTAPLHGTVVLNADGSFTYTPDVAYKGADSIVYKVCDTGNLCDTARVLLTIRNQAPLAVNDTVNVIVPQPVMFSILTNDNDPNGDPLTVTILGTLANGSLQANGNGSYTYTPDATFTGVHVLRYQVCDNATPALCDTASIVFVVPNQPPVANNDTLRTLEQQMVTGDLFANDSDPNGNTVLNATVLQAPKHGQIVINGFGSATYMPDAGFTGLDSAQYKVCDNGTPSRCDTAWVFITVGPGNLAPVAVDDTLNTIASAPVNANLMANDRDPDNNTLSVLIIVQPANGTVSALPDGSFTYTPATGFTGRDSLYYQLCDNGLPSRCDTAKVLINVGQVSRAPIAVDDTVRVNNLQPATINVLGNDNDPDGNTLTASLVTAPANGTVVLNADGGLTYTANGSFTGTDILVYQVCDNGTPSLCDTARVVFVVTQGNLPPIAINDTVIINNTQPASGNVLTNDRDPENGVLTPAILTAPANGTMELNADGSFTYIADPGFTGTDFADYRLCDNGTPSLCDTARIFFAVNQGNRAPVANNDTVLTNTLTPVTGNVLTNDIDPDGGTLTATMITAPANGTITLNGNGSFTYTPAAGFVGTEFIEYSVCDNGTPPLCDTARVVFIVGQGNRAPLATDDTVRTNSPQPVTVNALANDSDPDGNTLTATLIGQPANGTITLGANGVFTYTPNAGFAGTDGADYKVCDNGTPSLCDTGRITFVVTPNLPPVSNDDTLRVTGSSPVSGNVLTNDRDPNSNTGLTTSLVQGPRNGTLVINANGSVTYTANTGYYGMDTAYYKVCDNGTPALCDTAAIFVVIADVPRSSIGVAKAASEPILLQDGSYQFTYTFVLRNMGNNALTNISLTDDLTTTFPSPMEARVVSVTGMGTLVANQQFNGRGNIELLNTTSTLAAGVTDTLRLTLQVFPNKTFGTFNNKATVTGATPVGGTVSDLSTVGLNPDTNNDGLPSENDVTPIGLIEIKLRIPEGFSPNGDGKNDFFVIGNAGTDRIALEVYNRWGNVVYRSDAYQNNWNGKCNTGIRYGEDVPDGTYYYILRNLTTGEKFVSYITIMR
ncbi:Ig-like domain-containing protein [uncultured Chitinophaga sp.]|uniref:Ig-like domain-containing protein n=1 Tax=uncultured Chitinophaga sp. TaxID=339340 RepID=UPI0025E098C0|nr:Ig-like domain-containing protein [uncultured Chitinophaga sp.]